MTMNNFKLLLHQLEDLATVLAPYLPGQPGSDCGWGRVGAGQDWDLVLVDQDPHTIRTSQVARLLPRSRLIIVHDTENFEFNNAMKIPPDFV